MVPLVRFAEFSFDPATGELRRGDALVPLEHQPALALTHLIASAGRVVTREELAAAVWGSGVHVKFDDGLNYCVRRIRAALDDDAKSPRFIETLPRRGYRFVAITMADHGNTETQNHGNTETQHHGNLSGWMRFRRSWLRVAALLAAVTVGLAIVESRPNNHHEVAVAAARHLHDLIF